MPKEKDLNRVAKLEKLISQKYGEDAVVNPKAFWDEDKEKKYLDELKSLDEKEEEYEKNKKINKVEINGFLINENLFIEDTKRVCPICKVYSFSAKDDLYMNKYECCYKCYILHIEGREYNWEKRKGDLFNEINKRKSEEDDR